MIKDIVKNKFSNADVDLDLDDITCFLDYSSSIFEYSSGLLVLSSFALIALIALITLIVLIYESLSSGTSNFT
jgi:hypothetical protein